MSQEQHGASSEGKSKKQNFLEIQEKRKKNNLYLMERNPFARMVVCVTEDCKNLAQILEPLDKYIGIARDNRGASLHLPDKEVGDTLQNIQDAARILDKAARDLYEAIGKDPRLEKRRGAPYRSPYLFREESGGNGKDGEMKVAENPGPQAPASGSEAGSEMAAARGPRKTGK